MFGILFWSAVTGALFGIAAAAEESSHREDERLDSAVKRAQRQLEREARRAQAQLEAEQRAAARRARRLVTQVHHQELLRLEADIDRAEAAALPKAIVTTLRDQAAELRRNT